MKKKSIFFFEGIFAVASAYFVFAIIQAWNGKAYLLEEVNFFSISFILSAIIVGIGISFWLLLSRGIK